MGFITTFVFLLLYVLMQTQSIYGGDSGELVSAAYTVGIAHPPGYPLYMLAGAILSHTIPFGMVAWRMGFLSSVPMAVSVFFVWKIVYLVTKKILPSIVASFTYGLLYPVWLYAVVPEVFGLYALFSSAILYTFFRWILDKKLKHLYSMVFLAGLALTHQQMILLLIIPIVLFFNKQKNFQTIVQRQWKRMLAWFFLGLSPLLYLYFASFYSSTPYDWENASSFVGFIRLITRASFGTFKATYSAGLTIIDRFANVAAFGIYTWKDLTLFGAAFAIIGFWYLSRNQKQFFRIYVWYMLLLIFFFFYAGFPLINSIFIGTLERFYIVPYQALVIAIGIGIHASQEYARVFWKKHASEARLPVGTVYLLIILLALTISFKNVRKNYQPIRLLRTDTSMEMYGNDIMASIPPNAIVTLGDDTSLNAFSYLYYVQKKRPDITFLDYNLFDREFYRNRMMKRYPALKFPMYDGQDSLSDYLEKFILTNYTDKPVVHGGFTVPVQAFWVPHGLVSVFYKTLDEIPDRGIIIGKNIRLWNSFTNPLDGLLGTYRHLLLEDILSGYAQRRLIFTQALVYYKRTDEAKKQIDAMLATNAVSPRIFMSYINLLVEQKLCGDAKDLLNTLKDDFNAVPLMAESYYRTYKTCFPDQPEFKIYEKEYLKINKQSVLQ